MYRSLPWTGTALASRIPARSREANMAYRIGIIGIAGRMGQLLAEEVPAAGATLSGGIRRAGSANPAPAGVPLLPERNALGAVSDAVIDFTHASTAQATAATMAGLGKAWV